MFVYGRARLLADDGIEHVPVAYQDDGLQQLSRLEQSKSNTTVTKQRCQAGSKTPPVAHSAWVDDAGPDSQSPRQAAAQDVWGDLQHLTQAVLLDEQHATENRNGRPCVKNQQPCLQTNATSAVLNINRHMLAGLLHEQQQARQQQQQPAQPAGLHTPVSTSWHNKQQNQQHDQQRSAAPVRSAQQVQQQNNQQQQHEPPQPAPAAKFSQLLSSQQVSGKPQQQQRQKQARRSGVYSTPQHPAPKKKKATFSIKDTPVATAYGTPRQTVAAAPAAAAAGGNPLAALLGGAGTPARQRQPAAAAGVGGAVNDNSRTPHAGKVPDMAALFATPRFSTTKTSRFRAAAAAAGLNTPATAAVTPSLGAVATAAGGTGSCSRAAGSAMDIDGAAIARVIEDEAGMVPAALFGDDEADAAAFGHADGIDIDPAPMEQQCSIQQSQQQLQHSNRAAAEQTAATPLSVNHSKAARSNRRISSSVSSPNPIALMSEQRKREAQFLQALPIAAQPTAGSAGNIAAALRQNGGRGAAVPAGSSLAKVMQQIQTAQKEQQENLSDMISSSNSLGAGHDAQQGAVDVAVISKSWEAHIVKCLCRVTRFQQAQQQQQTQQQGQQQQLQPGQQVFVFVPSKTGHTVELSHGSTVRLHAPWYDGMQQQADQAPVLLAYLVTAVP